MDISDLFPVLTCRRRPGRVTKPNINIHSGLSDLFPVLTCRRLPNQIQTNQVHFAFLKVFICRRWPLAIKVFKPHINVTSDIFVLILHAEDDQKNLQNQMQIFNVHFLFYFLCKIWLKQMPCHICLLFKGRAARESLSIRGCNSCHN